MEIHVYSVWDFMNLLTYLQQHLTCISIPWKPYQSAALTRLINEIVLEEESDFIVGEATSHFLYYVNAIKKIDPTRNDLMKFCGDLHSEITYPDLIQQSYIPRPAQAFMQSTYEFTQISILHVAAAFTFGREALVPRLFEPIKNQLTTQGDKHLSQFISYLERHIELDGEQHSVLAYQMINELAHTEQDWNIIKDAAITALKARIAFWDGILESIKK